MRFREGQSVYYANPFSFNIELVTIIEDNVDTGDGLGYIERTGAYLTDRDCFTSLEDARKYMESELFKFYQKRLKGIRNDVPTLRTDEEVGY